jgi:hypothetical protein
MSTSWLASPVVEMPVFSMFIAPPSLLARTSAPWSSSDAVTEFFSLVLIALAANSAASRLVM